MLARPALIVVAFLLGACGAASGESVRTVRADPPHVQLLQGTVAEVHPEQGRMDVRVAIDWTATPRASDELTTLWVDSQTRFMPEDVSLQRLRPGENVMIRAVGGADGPRAVSVTPVDVD